MNELIKELAIQSGAGEWGDSVVPVMMDIETFAELIVEECVDVLLKWKGQPFPFDEDLAANLIKEHFGVK